MLLRAPRPELGASRRRLLEFLFAFCCVFAGLALPPGLGPVYTRLHAAIGNALVSGELASGVELSVTTTPEQLQREPWQATLSVVPPPPQTKVLVPIDLRGLMFLPTVTFIALAAAAPLGSARRNLFVLGLGLPLLELLLLVLNCVPMLSFLGGTGPVLAFSLGRGTHTFLQIIYRALVAPLGMMFALPLFLWWILVSRLGGFAGFRNSDTAVRIPASDDATAAD
jgi:hypothetical protein